MSQRRSILHAVVFLCVSASLAVAAEPSVTAELPAPATTPLWDIAAEGRRPELLVGAADDLAWSLGPDSFYNRVGPVAMLRAPKWGPLREVTAQLAVLFYTHERYLAGAPYLAFAVSAATPNFIK